MKKILILIYSVLLLYNLSYTENKNRLNLDEILKKVDDIRAPSNHFKCELEIVCYKNDKETSVKKFELYVGDETKSLVKFVYPYEDKGKFLLMVEENLWFYNKRTKNPIRITPQQRLLGEVSNSDVARVVYSVDYTPLNAEEVVIGDTHMYKLFLKAKTKAAYDSITLFVDKETYKPYKAEFYTVGGKLLKTAYYKNYQMILDKERPTETEIIDEIRKGNRSVIKYSNFEIKEFPSYYFQKEHLQYMK